MPSQGNRRVKPSKGGRTPRQAAATAAAAELRAHRPAAKRKVNRRVRGEGEGPRRAAIDPMERKVRNRTILLLTLLALVNAYVFVWREGTSVLELSLIHISEPTRPY